VRWWCQRSIRLIFYKIFGYPTGVGCLLARKAALAKLHRPWYAGGTITLSSIIAANMLERKEEGEVTSQRPTRSTGGACGAIRGPHSDQTQPGSSPKGEDYRAPIAVSVQVPTFRYFTSLELSNRWIKRVEGVKPVSSGKYRPLSSSR
jgi:hypothetical protein